MLLSFSLIRSLVSPLGKDAEARKNCGSIASVLKKGSLAGCFLSGASVAYGVFSLSSPLPAGLCIAAGVAGALASREIYVISRNVEKICTSHFLKRFSTITEPQLVKKILKGSWLVSV